MSETRRETVLVVYDSRSICETVSVMEVDNTYEVIELDDPGKIIETLEKVKPDIVLLCAMTREATAYDNCRLIKNATEGFYTPVLIYAIRVDSAELEKAFSVDADDLVQVTIAPETLLWRVRTLLKTKSFVRESVARSQSLARASAEAADMLLQLEEADRRISEQQKEIEKHLRVLEHEMELAAALQINMLPTEVPNTPELALYDRYIPAAELCGDYYDYVQLPDSAFHVSIADVTGHGVAPALVCVQVRTMARASAQAGLSPSEILDKLNEFMLSTFDREYLMTMIALNYNPESHAITYSGAGHCPIVMMPADGGPPTELPSLGLPLGVTADAEFVDTVVQLELRDRMLLYTDGISEAVGEKGLLGPERLIQFFTDVRDSGGREALDSIIARTRSFATKAVFDDDVTLVLMERREAT